MTNKDAEAYTDVSNVENNKTFLPVEEFPEGPFGSPRGKEEPVENKSSDK